MNRFLQRKKDRTPDDASSTKKGKKGKKTPQPEPEPQLDLTTALPAADDFRTSLIMPSLSTRFSMLKEQDDPSSKLGKASDDSVLHPKRQSRLHEFGFVPGGLSDIAEVSSLNGSIRPPFLNERSNSFDSSNPTDDGTASVMSRSRGFEGNVLFGGRQKIYKVSNSGLSKGRMVYDDDVNMSAFQKFKMEERERSKMLNLGDHDVPRSEPTSPAMETHPPGLPNYNQRRETSSSTNSGTADTRSSTAATSIASQGANSVAAASPALPNAAAAPISPVELTRSGTKGRRLYDQALEQHMYDQQSSALNRLNSIQRTRAPTGRSTPPLVFIQTKSNNSLHDRFNRGANFRTESPTSMLRDNESNASSPIISRPQSPPPGSPLTSDGEDHQTLNSALQPNDRGKATAMGAFNKPKQAFNEEQYAERLRQMQQDRETPASRPEPSISEKVSKHQKPSLRERAAQEQRKRAETMGRYRSPSTTSQHAPEVKDAPSAFSVFQSAANHMRSEPKQHMPTMAESRPEPAPAVKSPESRIGTTFFASPGSSEDEDETPMVPIMKPAALERRLHNLPTATGPAPPIFDHPALRSRSNSREPQRELASLRSRSRSNSRGEALDRSGPQSRSNSRPPLPTQSTYGQGNPEIPQQSAMPTQTEGPDIDSPTLGPANGGLSGLIRQHLRNVSTVSSDYGEANQIAMSPPPTSTAAPLAPQIQQTNLPRRQPYSGTDTPENSSYTHSNPWDLDDIDNYGEGESVSSVSPQDAYKHKPHATANGDGSNVTTPGLNETVAEWEKEIKKTHKREPSADERQNFMRDLALRQRAIQESLRNDTPQPPVRNRNHSPAPGQPTGGLKSALSMLRAKSSRESFATVDQRQAEHPSKAMRMLGLGGNSANGSTTSLSGPYANDHWRSENTFAREPTSRKMSRTLQQSEQDAQRENRERSATNDSNRDPRPKGRTTPVSGRSSGRDRSSSEVSSGRSRSRPPAARRDEYEQAPSPALSAYAFPSTPSAPADRPSPESQGRMRSRSNSKTTAANYFESKHLQPLQTAPGMPNGGSSRLSPAANSPNPQFSPGLPASPRPSPGAPSPSMNSTRPQGSPVPPPFPAHHTPPLSGTTTPVTAGFTTGAGAIMPSGTLRKKSIAKADISEPIFLSTTSVIDTVNLPQGASLKNGIEPPPPVPPINPRRRRFGLGRAATDDPTIHSPGSSLAESTRTNSSDALSSYGQPRQRLRKTSSEGHSLHGIAHTQAGANAPVPAMPFAGRNGSPPRPINNQPVAQQNMDGAMF